MPWRDGSGQGWLTAAMPLTGPGRGNRAKDEPGAKSKACLAPSLSSAGRRPVAGGLVTAGALPAPSQTTRIITPEPEADSRLAVTGHQPGAVANYRRNARRPATSTQAGGVAGRRNQRHGLNQFYDF